MHLLTAFAYLDIISGNGEYILNLVTPRLAQFVHLIVRIKTIYPVC